MLPVLFILSLIQSPNGQGFVNKVTMLPKSAWFHEILSKYGERGGGGRNCHRSHFMSLGIRNKDWTFMSSDFQHSLTPGEVVLNKFAESFCVSESSMTQLSEKYGEPF